MLKSITQLPLAEQDRLRETVGDYQVQVDPRTFEQYVRFMGENVSVKSIHDSRLLLG
jgi:hypothetical protein